MIASDEAMTRTENKAELLISIVVFQEGDHFVARGLEHDICVQAATIPKLLTRFEKVALASYFACVAEGLEFATSFPPAAREFWDMFETARRGPPLTRAGAADAPLVIPQIRYIEGLAA